MGTRGQNENIKHGAQTKGRDILTAETTLSYRTEIENGLSGKSEREIATLETAGIRNSLPFLGLKYF